MKKAPKTLGFVIPPEPPLTLPYTRAPDEGYTGARGNFIIRSRAEVAAATTGTPSVAEGLSLRMPMC